MKSSCLLLAVPLLLTSCASNTKSRLATTGVGFGVGAVIGSASAPDDERPELHALYWGGLVGVAASVAANYYFNDEKQREFMEIERDKLQAQLEVCQKGPTPILQAEKTAKKGKARINIFKVQEWIPHNNKMYRCDQMIETVEPLSGE